jgi:DNA polymerase III subunit epsilon
MTQADTVIVLDFETTGLSPNYGDRAIEIGAVRIDNGVATERFQALMNPGKPIDSFIEDYTGITNQMLKKALPCNEVMEQFADFIDGYNLVAHNASFDKRFLDAELGKISRGYSGQFACSMLMARRVYQSAPNHQLSTLVNYTNIQSDGSFHRALYDAEMTAKLWLVMIGDVTHKNSRNSFSFLQAQQLTRTAKKDVNKLVQAWSG